MKQILTSVCALTCLAGCSCPQTTTSCPPPKKTACCYDDFREPYRIAYPRLRPVAEQVEISNTQRALAMRQAAVLRQREGVRFEAGMLAATPQLSQPAATGVVAVGSTEGAGVYPTGNEPVPQAPLYPGPQAQSLRSVPPVSQRLPRASAPIAMPVAGKPGYVHSPFMSVGSQVDVQGFAPGSLAKDPYSGRTFRVP